MKKMISTSLLILNFTLFSSCLPSHQKKNSKASFPQTEINQNEIIQSDGSNVQGKYSAEIWPVNYNLHLKQIGMIEANRDNDNFSVSVKLNYGPKETLVRQALFTGRRCPNINDDLNKDAYIDIQEAKYAIGKITIPFDGDLSSQDAGQNEYPTVDSKGKMNYFAVTSFSLMFEDLKNIDENLFDEIIKIGEDQGITLPGRIVLLQGIPKKVVLPETVASEENTDKYETLPVGCAVLWKTK